MNHRDRTIPLLVLGAIGTIFFICASALFVYDTTEHLVASRDWRDHSQEVLTVLQTASQRLDRIDLYERLYLLGKDQDDQRDAQTSTISLDGDLIHVDDLVKDNPDQTSRAQTLHSCILDLKQRVNNSLTPDASLHQKILDCRDAVSKMQGSERTLLTQRTTESQKSIYRSLLAGIGFLVASLAVVIVLFGFLIRDAKQRRQMERRVFSTNAQLEVTVLTLKKRAAEAALLISAREELQLCTNAAQAHAAVVRYCSQLLPSTNVSLLLVNNSRNIVEIASSSPGETRLMDVFSLDACCGLRSGRLRWRKPGESEVNCGHFRGTPPDNYLCIPLSAQGDTLGILYIECPTSLIGIDVERNKESLEELAEMAAMSIAGLNLRERLEHQSIRDGLTDLFNRHFMEISLDREVRRAARNHAELSVLMLDVDHFKLFNDSFGHEAGDSALRGVADIFRQSVRAEDIICRYGGEEFVIILPETDQHAALERAEAIREQVSRMSIRFRGEALGQFTISIGLATYPKSGETLEELLRAADRALYAAKHGGRNQVVVAHPEVATV
ncbi:GGDEF domain-containing protein [Acidobacterium sp. S8]|uniref:GGDEF domain-containing protein n=1 Tax=Acidobacterium sp. S8 TaxID=1641854 RepID=UPI00131A71F7|nr:GGDEF domain-containing protein [Acidobacterium sp. S8]